MNRNDKILCKDYLAFVREHPCCVCGLPAVDAHHVKAKGGGSGKQNDFTAVPLCREHHAEIHRHGVSGFHERWSVDPWAEAVWLLIEFLVVMKSSRSAARLTMGKDQWGQVV